MLPGMHMPGSAFSDLGFLLVGSKGGHSATHDPSGILGTNGDRVCNIDNGVRIDFNVLRLTAITNTFLASGNRGGVRVAQARAIHQKLDQSDDVNPQVGGLIVTTAACQRNDKYDLSDHDVLCILNFRLSSDDGMRNNINAAPDICPANSRLY